MVKINYPRLPGSFTFTGKLIFHRRSTTNCRATAVETRWENSKGGLTAKGEQAGYEILFQKAGNKMLA